MKGPYTISGGDVIPETTVHFSGKIIDPTKVDPIPKKRRGRPPGSKNKPKGSAIIRFTSAELVEMERKAREWMDNPEDYGQHCLVFGLVLQQVAEKLVTADEGMLASDVVRMMKEHGDLIAKTSSLMKKPTESMGAGVRHRAK